MALLQSGLSMLAGKMPKILNPRAHAVADYAVAGAFLVGAAVLWRRRRRAAVGCLVCAGTTAATSLITDYPGGAWPLISFRTHGRIEAGLAGATAALPRVLGFSGKEESKLFGAAALASTILTAATDYDAHEESSPDWRRASREGVA